MKPVPHTRPVSLFGTTSPSLLNSVATTPVRAARRPLLIWVAAAGLFATASSPAVAQEYALLTSKPQAAEKSVESTKAYWKMTTEPGADSTLVGFYTPANQLLFEEKLPNDAVKLTKRNLRKLNETTDHLMNMNGKTADAHTLSDALAGEKVSRAGQLQMGTYASRDGIHLHVMLENPAHDYVMIELLGKDGRTVYTTSTRLDKAHYKLNLDGMPEGDYRLRVLGKSSCLNAICHSATPKPDPSFPTLRVAIK